MSLEIRALDGILRSVAVVMEMMLAIGLFLFPNLALGLLILAGVMFDSGDNLRALTYLILAAFQVRLSMLAWKQFKEQGYRCRKPGE